MKVTVTNLLLVWLFASGSMTNVHASDDPRGKCRDLFQLTDISYAVEPGVWVEAANGIPAHCRLRGVVNRAIRVEVTMPENWNRRMMFSAVGGTAGVLGDTQSLLPRGFAMATTDTGHEGPPGATEFMRQPEALIDYAYRGNHLATVFAKHVIAYYYGKPVGHAYLTGCSNGGRAVLMEALRFPDDYDGIIAGAPAFRFQEFVLWLLHLDRVQQADPLTLDAVKLLGDASRKSCDKLDGVEDGVINDPRQCTADIFDLDALECQAGQTADCLTAGQIENARATYGGLFDENGEMLSPGLAPGAEDAGDWGSWGIGGTTFTELSGVDSSLNTIMTHMLGDLLFRDPSFDIDNFDPVADRHKLDAAAALLDINTADFSAFRERGGKLLMYQGWSDYPLRPQRAIDYLADVEAANGGAERTADFYRLFMVPGMTHCAGGPGPWQADYVAPMVDWVEKSNAPERIVGTQPGIIDVGEAIMRKPPPPGARTFTRPLCPYPQKAAYSGRGDVDDEKNWQCVTEQLGNRRPL